MVSEEERPGQGPVRMKASTAPDAVTATGALTRYFTNQSPPT